MLADPNVFYWVDRSVWVNSSAPCRVKSFRKAVSTVMDDLVKVLANKIIDNLHLMILINLTSKLDYFTIRCN